MGRFRGGICGLLIGRNGLIVEVVVVSLRSSVCQGRFWYGNFFIRSGLLNGYLNAELLGLIKIEFCALYIQSGEAGSQIQNPNTPGIVNWHRLFSSDSAQ